MTQNTIKPHSAIIAPFLRTTNSPMELDYIFDSVDKLALWARDNASILHEGLVKVVVEPDDLVFYTFVRNSDGYGYKYEKVISINDIPSINDSVNSGNENLDKFKNEVAEEIKRLHARIQAIWGVQNEATLPEGMNSIAKIIETVSALIKTIKDLEIKNTDKALAGTTEDDVIAYLQKLRYGSITMINNVIDRFFNMEETGTNSIDTWVELKNFLRGFKDSDNLLEFINDNLGHKLSFESTNTIKMTRLELKDRDQIKSDLILDPSNDNCITVRKDGVYMNVRIEYENNSINFYVNDNLKKSINISDFTIKVKDHYYDPATESLIIILATSSGESKIRIPMSIMLREWEVSNNSDSPIELDLDAAVGSGKDKLSAKLKISTIPDNLVEVKDGSVYVKTPTSNDIKHSDSNVGHILDKLSENNKHNEEILSKFEAELEGVKSDVNNIIIEIDKTKNELNNKIDTSIMSVENSILQLSARHDSDKEAILHSIDDVKNEFNAYKSQNESDKIDIINSINSNKELIMSISKNLEEYKSENDLKVSAIKDELEKFKIEMIHKIHDIEETIKNNHKWIEAH